MKYLGKNYFPFFSFPILFSRFNSSRNRSVNLILKTFHYQYRENTWSIQLCKNGMGHLNLLIIIDLPFLSDVYTFNVDGRLVLRRCTISRRRRSSLAVCPQTRFRATHFNDKLREKLSIPEICTFNIYDGVSHPYF